MTLEDFFTLTEMKDGLTAPSRVHELVAVMQKEKDCIVKNVGDATRQWAAVASTIAATENKDCLELFIQLDGLCFIGRWLKDVQKFGNDTADGFIEESITALLRALEKLQIDKERSISSGIWITVHDLLDHSSTRVQDRARALFDSWKQGRISETINHDVQSMGTLGDANVLTSENNRADCTAVEVSLSKRNDDVENIAAEPAKDENLQSNSNCLQTEKTEVVQIQTDHSMEDRSLDPLTTSVLSNSVQESPSLREKSSMSIGEGTALTETHSFTIPKGQSAEPELDASKKLSSFSENLSMVASPSSKVEPGASSSSVDAASAKEMTEPAQQNSADAKEGDFDLKISAFGSKRTSTSPPRAGTNDVGFINHSNTQAFKSTSKDDHSHDTQQDSSHSDQKLEKTEDTGTPFSRMAHIGAADDDREHSSDGADDLRDDSDFSKPAINARSPDPIDRRRSDIDLEFGIVDALEVARQVAQEVEREVVDYREPSCSSSSEKIMDSDVREPDSPDSINGKQESRTEVPQEDIPAGRSLSAEAYPVEEGHLISSNNMDTEAENGTHELESSQVTEVAPGPEVIAEKSLCDFDLNQEVCSDDMDRPINPISAPISVVSASRPAAASGSPSAPLQFEGILGWKGSAATSAFRPASPRKISDSDKILDTGGTSSISKQRQDSLDIDLNIAEDGDEKVDFISGRPILVSSGLHSAESSLEVGPRRSERPNLDLNRISDDGDAPPSSLRMGGQQLFYPRNGHRSPSPASSSSSMQPSLRNFDLNDRPFFHNDSSDQGLYLSSQNASASGGSKSGDPIISIMGTRVEVGSRIEVGRKDFVPQNPSMPNGKPLDPAMDANLARIGGVLGVPTVSYAHSPVFGYNGLTTVPTMSISSAVYGPGASIPYMDTRAHVVPQLLSSASAVPAYSQPSFIMSMSGAPVNLNGAGPSRPSLDLNSGFAFEGGGGGLRQLFMPSQSRSMEEHLRANMQSSSSSGVGGKRREPDSGWEPYSLPYKNPQHPWR
ncbi:hypothetical protein JCGZ_08196 [Jatropha curcas]|uniref:TFIIS N-terminal domain-containing protein n=1 Tax=Jatropha curcas TaxID=180498 RepID=A0A067KXA4_JATCU|nr:uncharacterized protein LOC105635322 [Jatropha curcas]XP_012073777.1 uncharacterized protein LOC105635322 [Jatropha curcas]KDP36905.1 hypothetical protein JCGZ_08196 [Jatropha curcas]